MQQTLASQFELGFHLLIPLVVLLTLAIKKMPAFPAIAIGALLGVIWALVFQDNLVSSFANKLTVTAPDGIHWLFKEIPEWIKHIMVTWSALFDGVSFDTGDESLDKLLSRGGMSSMLNTVWLIICAMSFGAVLEKVGLLKAVVATFLKGATSAGDMISRTILTCIGTNIITADQYISIVMPGRMYKEEFEKRGLDQLNL